jgi:hypothetical protein
VAVASAVTVAVNAPVPTRSTVTLVSAVAATPLQYIRA